MGGEDWHSCYNIINICVSWKLLNNGEIWKFSFCFVLFCYSDGLHLTPDGNAIVYQEVIKVFDETSLSAEKMPADVPHHSTIDGKQPEKAFQLQCPAT